ncbi:hypothetical protein C7B77_14695 [Chamaesiphon polymorphus CCALA 037]|uniref:Uncharacterized protein n=1 Tax=Chamaesiphon polymorphus CCALA 037 TaxID=2107692 RepID=A0A2T1GDS6_9CYAN|nr:hypothetical protein C7B77_14695 [Chamaesiphon polymorphus CCALA 037]
MLYSPDRRSKSCQGYLGTILGEMLRKTYFLVTFSHSRAIEHPDAFFWPQNYREWRFRAIIYSVTLLAKATRLY